jgi:hypothetical protein
MGTSASTLGLKGSNPLIPPWAEQSDSLIISTDEPGSDSTEQSIEIDNDQVQKIIGTPTTANDARGSNQGPSRAFGDYAKSGSRDDLKSALKSYGSKSSGGGVSTSRRLASGITAGAALFGLMSGAQVSTESNGSLSLGSLLGLTTDQAIDKIVEHLSPESGDADKVRVSLDYALNEALEEVENFGDVEFTPDVVNEIYLCYLTDLIFQDVVTSMGKAWFHAETYQRAANMERELRDLIMVITESKMENSLEKISKVDQVEIIKFQADVIANTIEAWEDF